jgi:aminopeptidase N
MRARLAIILCLAAACGGDDGGGDDDALPVDAPIAEEAAVTVGRYEYEIDLESRAASSRLNVDVTTDGRCIALANRNANIDLANVRIDDAVVSAVWGNAKLIACKPQGESVGTGAHTLAVTITQQPLERWGASQVGYTVTPDNVQANPQSYFYMISWVEGCDRFGPCDTRPGTFAQYRFTIRHRSGVRALCPGTLTPGDTTSICEFTHDGGPTYSTFGFIAYASWTESSRGSWDGVNVSLFERAGSNFPTAPAIDNAYHAGFVEWMQDTFGPYPYGGELRIVIAPTYWSGFEHPGNIVLDNALANPNQPSSYTRPVAHVLNHEIAHQWAGDETTLADTYDFVWKEAMAEYLSFVWEDMNNPTEALATARAWKSFAPGAAYHPVPEDSPRPTILDYYGEVYGPGPMILFRQLEVMTSREQVLAGIAAVLGSPRALSVDELQAALETSTGLELDAYFDVWVRGSGPPVWPTFTINVTGAAPNQMVTVAETTPGGVLHGCNVSVELRGAGGETETLSVARGVNGMASVSVPTGVTWSVTQTVFDPLVHCLGFAPTFAAPPRHPPGWTPW